MNERCPLCRLSVSSLYPIFYCFMIMTGSLEKGGVGVFFLFIHELDRLVGDDLWRLIYMHVFSGGGG